MDEKPENKIFIIPTSEEAFGTPPPAPQSSDPKKEETPASFPPDPRFKSPDDFLSKSAPNLQGKEKPRLAHPPDPDELQPKSENESLHFGMPELATIRNELQTERTEKEEKSSDPAPFRPPKDGVPIDLDAAVLTTSLQTAKSNAEDHARRIHELLIRMKEKHAREIAQWKEYAQNVKAWQAQVMGIIDNLKKELRKAQEAEAQINELRALLREKDEEILSFHEKGKAKIIDWMKCLGKIPRPQHP